MKNHGKRILRAVSALLCLAFVAGFAAETPETVEIADSDGDGAITVSDSLAILRVAAKLKESL